MFQITMKDASLSSDRIRKAEHIVFDKEGVSEGNRVQVGDVKWDNIVFIDNELSGQESDGKIGTSMFNNKTFKIDYNNSQFIIYDEMPDTTGFRPIPLTCKNEAMFNDLISIIDGRDYKHPFYLQSGYPGGLLYNNQFLDNNKIDEKLKVTNEKVLKKLIWPKCYH